MGPRALRRLRAPWSIARRAALHVTRRGRGSQGGAPRTVSTGVTSGGCTQLAVSAGEDGQSPEAGWSAVAADEAVQGDTGRKVFQNEEPGRHVGGDHPRATASPRSSGRNCSAAVRYAAAGGRCVPGGAGPHPFHDNRPAGASPPSSTRATAQGSRRSQRSTATGAAPHLPRPTVHPPRADARTCAAPQRCERPVANNTTGPLR